MGAWIETCVTQVLKAYRESHPIWVRGLKQKYIERNKPLTKSHPIWVRGLKLQYYKYKKWFLSSHPIWVRGLKQICGTSYRVKLGVAPHMGAWIETYEWYRIV